MPRRGKAIRRGSAGPLTVLSENCRRHGDEISVPVGQEDRNVYKIACGRRHGEKSGTREESVKMQIERMKIEWEREKQLIEREEREREREFRIRERELMMELQCMGRERLASLRADDNIVNVVEEGSAIVDSEQLGIVEMADSDVAGKGPTIRYAKQIGTGEMAKEEMRASERPSSSKGGSRSSAAGQEGDPVPDEESGNGTDSVKDKSSDGERSAGKGTQGSPPQRTLCVSYGSWRQPSLPAGFYEQQEFSRSYERPQGVKRSSQREDSYEYERREREYERQKYREKGKESANEEGRNSQENISRDHTVESWSNNAGKERDRHQDPFEVNVGATADLQDQWDSTGSSKRRETIGSIKETKEDEENEDFDSDCDPAWTPRDENPEKSGEEICLRLSRRGRKESRSLGRKSAGGKGQAASDDGLPKDKKGSKKHVGAAGGKGQEASDGGSPKVKKGSNKHVGAASTSAKNATGVTYGDDSTVVYGGNNLYSSDDGEKEKAQPGKEIYEGVDKPCEKYPGGVDIFAVLDQDSTRVNRPDGADTKWEPSDSEALCLDRQSQSRPGVYLKGGGVRFRAKIPRVVRHHLEVMCVRRVEVVYVVVDKGKGQR